MKERLWIGTQGEITCEEHAGFLLKSAIQADPETWHHETELDWWIRYNSGEYKCETCVQVERKALAAAK